MFRHLTGDSMMPPQNHSPKSSQNDPRQPFSQTSTPSSQQRKGAPSQKREKDRGSLQPNIPTLTVHVPRPSNLKPVLQIAGPAAGIEQGARPAGVVEQMP